MNWSANRFLTLASGMNAVMQFVFFDSSIACEKENIFN